MDGFAEFFRALVRNAVVAMREVDVVEIVFLGELDVGSCAIDANDGFDAEIGEFLESGFAIREAAGDDFRMDAVGVGEVGSG